MDTDASTNTMQSTNFNIDRQQVKEKKRTRRDSAKTKDHQNGD